MKRKDRLTLLLACIIAAIVAFVISSAIFRSATHNSKAPNIQVIDANMPDVKNESSYNTVFYQGVLDLTQPVQIGNSTNSSPF